MLDTFTCFTKMIEQYRYGTGRDAQRATHLGKGLDKDGVQDWQKGVINGGKNGQESPVMKTSTVTRQAWFDGDMLGSWR